MLIRINTCSEQQNKFIDIIVRKLQCVLKSLFIFSSSLFEYSLLHDKHLYFIKLSLTLSYLRKQSQSLHLILWISSARLSARFDIELAINFTLSINFILLDIVATLSLPSLSIFVTYFSIGPENILYFSIISPTQSSCPSNLSANSLMIKW